MNIKHSLHGYVLLFLLLIMGSSVSGQIDLKTSLSGYWEGGFIKDNSLQKLQLHIYPQGDQLLSLQIMEEWHPQFGEFVLPVEIDSLGQVVFNTGYGKAISQLDWQSNELYGRLEESGMFIHLKKIPAPPQPLFRVEEIKIQNREVSLHGHLHHPAKANKNAIIIIGGRGCGPANSQFDLHAKLLRQYGLTVLVYSKRGNGQSTGDCERATINDLASDLIAARNYLKNQYNFTKIGVLGSSAGAWVMAKAAETTEFDFMISVAGPATSVRLQQMRSADLGGQAYGISGIAQKELLDYTALMFDAKPNRSSFRKMSALLQKAEINGWKELLEETDIPASAAEIDNLWVRRHRYDPKASLLAYKNPYLAIFGSEDWIVPYLDNLSVLQETIDSKNLSILIAYDGEHGMEAGAKKRTLANGQSYWRFFRVAPSVQISMIEFLRKHQLIP